MDDNTYKNMDCLEMKVLSNSSDKLLKSESKRKEKSFGLQNPVYDAPGTLTKKEKRVILDSTKDVGSQNVVIPQPDYDEASVCSLRGSDIYEEFDPAIPSTSTAIPTLDYAGSPPSQMPIYENFPPVKSFPLQVKNTVEADKDVAPKRLEGHDRILQRAISEESLSTIHRIKEAKLEKSFCGFVSFVINLILKKVFQFYLLDLYIFVSGICLVALGYEYFQTVEMLEVVDPYRDEICKSLPALNLIVGTLSMIIPVMKICIQCCKTPGKAQSIFLLLYVFLYVALLFFSIEGTSKIFLHFPPNLEDPCEFNFCPGSLYWTTMYIFTVYSATHLAIVILGIILITCYFCK